MMMMMMMFGQHSSHQPVVVEMGTASKTRILTPHLLCVVWNSNWISATELWNRQYMLLQHLGCLDRSLCSAVNFCVTGKWPSWAKCTPSREIVAWARGTKWREVVIITCYVEVLSYALHCCHDIHGVCCCLPVPRTCEFKKMLRFFWHVSVFKYKLPILIFTLLLTSSSPSICLGSAVYWEVIKIVIIL